MIGYVGQAPISPVVKAGIIKKPLNIYEGVGSRSERIKFILKPGNYIQITNIRRLSSLSGGMMFGSARVKGKGASWKTVGLVRMEDFREAISPTIEPIAEAVEPEPSKIPIVPILIAGTLVVTYLLFGKKLGIR